MRESAARWGDKDFVVLGDQRLTYADADRRSAELAKGLLVSGVGKGTTSACSPPTAQSG
ncbi:MAG: hypothetical protein R2746_16615 [Acidimicrobiales bacterium]